MNKTQRLARLEAICTTGLSERAKAWLGQRPPLTPAEEAECPDLGNPDLSGCSPELREWLSQ
jgi:hypothetical protein